MEEMIHGLHRASPGWKKKKISRYIHYPVAVTAHVSAASIKNTRRDHDTHKPVVKRVDFLHRRLPANITIPKNPILPSSCIETAKWDSLHIINTLKYKEGTFITTAYCHAFWEDYFGFCCDTYPKPEPVYILYRAA